MKIKVLLFAQLRDLHKGGDLLMDLPEGSTVEDVKKRLPGLESMALPPLTCAVNCEQASFGIRLRHGDEVALLPPVSGG